MKTIQLQHVCLLLAIAALVVCLCFPLLKLVYSDGSSIMMSNFHIAHSDGTHSSSPWALGGILMAATLCLLFVLLVSFFRNFTLQKRGIVVGMLLMTGYYLVLLVFVLILRPDVELAFPRWTGILPLVSILLTFMAFNAIRRTEARIIASANNFRLRD